MPRGTPPPTPPTLPPPTPPVEPSPTPDHAAPLMPALPAPECGNCRFWDNTMGAHETVRPGQTGLCRRNAPVPVAIFNKIKEHTATGITYAAALWPSTIVGENCGQHDYRGEYRS